MKRDDDREVAALRRKTLPAFVLAILTFFIAIAGMAVLWMLAARTMRL